MRRLFVVPNYFPSCYERQPIMLLSKRIRLEVIEAIEKQGLTQSQIALRCDIDQSNLSRFIRGERWLTIEALDKLYQYLMI